MTWPAIPVDAGTRDWPRKVANAVNRLQNTTAIAGGTATWGSVSGNIADQSDLQGALDGKQDAGSYLEADNNLSDVSNDAAARSNLGLEIGTDVAGFTATQDALALKADLAGAKFTGLVDTPGMRATGTNVTGATGGGIDILHNGTTGTLLSYNRTTNAYLPFGLRGSAIEFRIGTSIKFLMDASAITLSLPTTVPDEAYGASWDGSTQVPTKNAVYDKIEALEGYTGWAVYNHGGANQAIAANTRTKLLIDGATKIESQLPTDTGPLWDTATSKIIGRNGDAIDIKIQFVFTPTTAAATEIDIEVDIGSPVGVVEYDTRALTRGAGNPHNITLAFPAYTLNTWQANGGEIYVRADGPGSVSALRIVIVRTHKARP